MLTLWDISKQQAVRRFMACLADVTSVSTYHLMPNLLVSGSCDSTARLWDVRTSKVVYTFRSHSVDVNAVRFFPNGQALATGSDDSSIKLFDVRTFQELSTFSHQRISSGVTSLDFSNSGRYLVAAYDDGACRAWDTTDTNQVPVQELQSHGRKATCIRVSPDGSALISSGWDEVLKLSA
jgi:guanine nucleotide-binding protein G(I)/G(S)/G(T) subunit beta-1